MATISEILPQVTLDKTKTTSLEVSSFSAWCEKLEVHRYVILVLLLAFQGSIIIPASLLIGQNLALPFADLGVLIGAITTFAVLVSNISMASMKVIVTTFILSLALNFSVFMFYLSSVL